MTGVLPAIPRPGRHANGRFGPGNPGRRAGTRNQLSNRVAISILEDFEANKEEVLRWMRKSRTEIYLALLIRMLPRPVEGAPLDVSTWSDAEVAAMVADARAAFDRTEDGRGVLIELEAVLLGESVAGAAASGHS